MAGPACLLPVSVRSRFSLALTLAYASTPSSVACFCLRDSRMASTACIKWTCVTVLPLRAALTAAVMTAVFTSRPARPSEQSARLSRETPSVGKLAGKCRCQISHNARPLT